jgi:RNA polymerase sigma-70 factor (ECF subfamily)
MANKDTESFLRLLVPNQKRIFSYIAKLIPNYADSEDVMQEVTELLWRKYAEYAPDTDFIAWALMIAKFKVFEYYKECKRHKNRLSNETVRILEKESQVSGDAYNAHLEAVNKCLKKLNMNDYNLIKLRYELNEKVRVTAARLGCSVQSVYSNLARIHNALLLCVNREKEQTR